VKVGSAVVDFAVKVGSAVVDFAVKVGSAVVLVRHGSSLP